MKGLLIPFTSSERNFIKKTIAFFSRPPGSVKYSPTIYPAHDFPLSLKRHHALEGQEWQSSEESRYQQALASSRHNSASDSSACCPTEKPYDVSMTVMRGEDRSLFMEHTLCSGEKITLMVVCDGLGGLKKLTTPLGVEIFVTALYETLCQRETPIRSRSDLLDLFMRSYTGWIDACTRYLGVPTPEEGDLTASTLNLSAICGNKLFNLNIGDSVLQGFDQGKCVFESKMQPHLGETSFPLPPLCISYPPNLGASDATVFLLFLFICTTPQLAPLDRDALDAALIPFIGKGPLDIEKLDLVRATVLERFTSETVLLPGQVFVAGSDGIFDNVFREQIGEVACGASKPRASDIVKKARAASLGDGDTPYSEGVIAHFSEEGVVPPTVRNFKGKPDDMSVLLYAVQG